MSDSDRDLDVYLRAASKKFNDDDIDFDSRDWGVVHPEEGGAWIMAWLWVDDSEIASEVASDD